MKILSCCCLQIKNRPVRWESGDTVITMDFDRDVGWSLNGSRKNIIQYDNATGRLYRMQAGGAWFTWSYLPGTNLKSQLTYGVPGQTLLYIKGDL